jgi:hypothetical protein
VAERKRNSSPAKAATAGEDSRDMSADEDGMSPAGPAKGEFASPVEVPDVDEREDALPLQEEFWRPPVRFGSVPVEKGPLGWDRRRGFRKVYPVVSLPTQVVSVSLDKVVSSIR